MINNISDNTTQSLSPLPHAQQPPSNSNNKIANHIAHAYNQPLSLEKLPVETIQNIAFNLEADSYAKLRLTSCELRDILPSFQTIISALKSECSGELKKSYASMYEKLIVDQLKNKTNNNALQAMKDISVDYQHSLPFYHHNIAIECWDENSIQDKQGDNILYSCQGIIDDNPGSEKLHTSLITRGKEYDNGIVKKVVYLGMVDNQINKESLRVIFGSFNEVFIDENTSNSNRLIVAISAHKLKDFLTAQTPNGINENDILHGTSQYSMLFKTGEIAINHILTK